MRDAFSSRHAVLFAAVSTALLSVAGCNRGGAAAQQQAQAMPPPSVVVAPVTTRDVPVYIDQIGKATAVAAVTITPRTVGQIISRQFEDGADVKRDQVLFEIDPAPNQAALQQAQAQVQSKQAALDFAKIELNRYETVAGTQAISKSDLDTKRNSVDVAAAELAEAQAAVNTAQINLGFCTIRSPIDGRAGSRMVDVGNIVQENITSLLSIQTLDPVYADFTVSEQELTDVRANMGNGQLKTMVRLPADQNDGREGALTFLDNAVQDGTGTVKLRATIPNADHYFWPGQFVNVRLILKTMKNSLLVPATATQISQQGPFVFVVHDDDKSPTKMLVAQQPVKLGQKQGDMVVVYDGLKAGDRVVTQGQMLLQGGMPVMVAPPGGAPSGGPQMPAASDAKKPEAAADSGAQKDGSAK